jgi:hypothetical protein
MTLPFRLALVFSLALVSGASSGCVPAGSVAAQRRAQCTVDAECTLVDVCGCECRAEPSRPLPAMACSESCAGTPCAGHRAACEAGTCVVR